MCPDDTNEIAEVPEDQPAAEGSAPAPVTQGGLTWNRRGILKAAALGAVAVGALSKLNLASAETLEDVNCQANDVRILGPGVIVNEPCVCNGSFNAAVAFRVDNNTGTDRYCVTSHLCAGINANGQTIVPAQDINLGTVGPGLSTVTATINNYPCGAGLVCFGAPGTQPDGGFAKGETCPPGQCCTVISWNVVRNDACPQPHDDIIKSKCRAQQVCIVGRATALTCVSNCTPACGGVSVLRASASGGTQPYVFSLVGDGTQTVTNSAGGSVSFTVTTTALTTYTVLFSTADNCTRTQSVTLSASPLPAFTPTASAPDCSGVTTITASVAGATNYVFSEITAFATVTSTPATATRTYTPTTTTQTHTITVVATNDAGCSTTGTTTVTVNPAVTATLAPQGTPGCDGVVTLLATAGGGSGTGYTFQFNGATGTVTGTGNTRTIAIQPVLNGLCREVTVTITDSQGCSATSDDVSFSSCVATTFDCAV